MSEPISDRQRRQHLLNREEQADSVTREAAAGLTTCHDCGNHDKCETQRAAEAEVERQRAETAEAGLVESNWPDGGPDDDPPEIKLAKMRQRAEVAEMSLEDLRAERDACVESGVQAADYGTQLEQERDGAYRERARLVAHLASQYPSVLAYNDLEDPDWPVVYLKTSVGQLSWHISPDDLDLFGHVPMSDGLITWDGHDTDTKYQRLAQLTEDGGQRFDEELAQRAAVRYNRDVLMDRTIKRAEAAEQERDALREHVAADHETLRKVWPHVDRVGLQKDLNGDADE